MNPKENWRQRSLRTFEDIWRKIRLMARQVIGIFTYRWVITFKYFYKSKLYQAMLNHWFFCYQRGNWLNFSLSHTCTAFISCFFSHSSKRASSVDNIFNKKIKPLSLDEKLSTLSRLSKKKLLMKKEKERLELWMCSSSFNYFVVTYASLTRQITLKITEYSLEPSAK